MRGEWWDSAGWQFLVVLSVMFFLATLGSQWATAGLPWVRDCDMIGGHGNLRGFLCSDHSLLVLWQLRQRVNIPSFTTDFDAGF